MSVLGRKARRDIGRRRWQYLTIAATVSIGVMLFSASYDAYLNLETSYNHTYDRLVFADLTITGGDTAGFAAQAETRAGVTAVSVRRQADIPIRVDGDHKLLGRIVELPGGGQPAVNQVDILRGSFPSPGGPAAVLVERHMADHFELEPGADVELLTSGRWTRFEVAGVVASPEYIWPARSRQDILTTPDDFGVIFAPSSVVDETAGTAATQALVRFDPDGRPARLMDELRADAAAARASAIEPRADQPSHAALQEDVAGLGELSFLFPMLFLGAASMATFVLLGRVVRSQRPQIATLVANGLSTRQVMVHYLGEGILVTGTAGVVGVALGVPLGRLVTGLYTDAISVPDTVTRFHYSTVVIGLALAASAGVVATAAPAIAAARVAPGEALRGLAPTGRGGRSAIERLVPPVGRLPARWRMVLRGIGRNRRRSLSTGMGVVLALTLILASWGMIDTVDILVDRQFDQIERQDAELYVAATDRDVVADIERVAGIERAERVVQAQVTLERNGQQYPTRLIAFGPDTLMHDFGTSGLPSTGLVVGRSLGSVLDVGVGDPVGLSPEGSSASETLPVVAFVDEPLGTLAYTTLPVADAFLTPEAISVMVTFTDDVDRAAMRENLSNLPGVVAYVDSRGLYDAVQSLLSLFYVFVGVMVVFGALMAFALLFNTSLVNVSERSSELAAIHVNGASPGQLTRLLAGENLLLTLMSIVPGLVVGYWVSARFMDSFSSDLFDFGLEIRARTVVLSAVAIIVVSALAQWPTARAVKKLDVARVVRERSQ